MNKFEWYVSLVLFSVVIVVVAAEWCCRNNWSLASAFSAMYGCLVMTILRFCAFPEYWMCYKKVPSRVLYRCRCVCIRPSAIGSLMVSISWQIARLSASERIKNTQVFVVEIVNVAHESLSISKIKRQQTKRIQSISESNSMQINRAIWFIALEHIYCPVAMLIWFMTFKHIYCTLRFVVQWFIFIAMNHTRVLPPWDLLLFIENFLQFPLNK